MKDCIGYTDRQAECLRQINKEEAKIGDYAKIDGFSGWCIRGASAYKIFGYYTI